MSGGRDVTAGWLFALATLIWGSTWLAIKFQLGVVAPEVSVAYRFGVAAAVLGAWCLATGRPLRFARREHAFIALQGVLLFGLDYVAVYWAEQYATSGLVAVSVVAFGAYLTLMQRVGPAPASYVGVATPVVALALSTVAEGYRWTWVAVLGVVLAVVGNALALSRPRGASFSGR